MPPKTRLLRSCIIILILTTITIPALAQSLGRLHFLESFAMRLYARGETAQAKKEFERILTIDPGNMLAKKFMNSPTLESPAQNSTMAGLNMIATDIATLRESVLTAEKETAELEHTIRLLTGENDNLYAALSKRSRDLAELRAQMKNTPYYDEYAQLMAILAPERVPQQLLKTRDLLSTPSRQEVAANDEIQALTREIAQYEQDLSTLAESQNRDPQKIAELTTALEEKRSLFVEKNLLLIEKTSTLSRIKDDLAVMNLSLKDADHRYSIMLEAIDRINRELKAEISSQQNHSDLRYKTLLSDYADRIREIELLKMQTIKTTAFLTEQQPVLEKQDTQIARIDTAVESANQDLQKYILLLEEYKAQLTQKDAIISEKIDLLSQKNDLLRNKDNALSEKNKIIEEKDSRISEKNNEIASKDLALTQKEQALLEKDKAIQEKDSILIKKDNVIADKDLALTQKEEALKEKNAILTQKESQLQETTTILAAKDLVINKKDDLIKDQNIALSSKETALAEKNANLEQKELLLSAQDATITQHTITITRQSNDLGFTNDELNSVGTQISTIEALLKANDRDISDLKSGINRMKETIRQDQIASSKTKDLKARLSRLERGLTKLESPSLEPVDDTFYSHFRRSEEELALSERELIKSRDEIDSLTLRLAANTLVMEELQLENARLRDQASEQITAPAPDAQTIIVESPRLSAEVLTLHEILASKDNELVELNKKFQDKNVEARQLAAMIQAYKAEIRKSDALMTTGYDQGAIQKTKIDKTLSESRNAILAYSLDSKEKESLIATLGQELANKDAAMTSASQQIAMLEERLAAIVIKQEAIKAVIAQRDQTIASLQATLDQAKEGASNNDDEKTQLRTTNHELEDKIAILQSQLRAENDEAMRMKAEIDTVRKELIAAHEQLTAEKLTSARCLAQDCGNKK